MIGLLSKEVTRLITNNAKQQVGYGSTYYYYEDDDDENDESYSQPMKPQSSRKLVVAMVVLGLLATAGIFLSTKPQQQQQQQQQQATPTTCRFCDQSPPVLHEDESYTIRIPDKNSSSSSTTATTTTTTTTTKQKTVTVTPMTVSYEYELRDGENLYTMSRNEIIPNLGFDYAVLGLTSFRNVHSADGTPVSLDEVYVHHFSLFPLNMLGAEVLARGVDGGNNDNNNDNNDDDYMRFPPGYALHILADEKPYLRTNAHLISNKNLEPIGGSIARAHKECNECYYAPGKGSECTPEVSGTFMCCGDSDVCKSGEELCTCATTTTTTTGSESTTTTTKYRIELDLLIAKEMDAFTRVEQWNLAAPSCSVNMEGNPVFEEYPPDSYCHGNNIVGKGDDENAPSSVLFAGGGAFFHQIPERPNTDPYVKTTASLVAPTAGTLVWAQSHLHTGGVNATLYRNGKILCSTTTRYGTDPDPSKNARNEKGHLVSIGSCYDAIGNKGGISFEEGDVFTTESYYYGAMNDPNLGPVSGGEHKNVMTMFFLGVVLEGNSEFLTERRTSFNLWNNFVPLAGVGRSTTNNNSNAAAGTTTTKTKYLRWSSSSF